MEEIRELRIAVIGGGAMGSAIISGLLSNPQINPGHLSVSNPHTEKLEIFKSKGVRVYADNLDAIQNADLIVLAVKPWILPEVICEIRDKLNLQNTEVCSIAAGINSEELKSFFKDSLPQNLCIAMPNTAMKVKESMTFIVDIIGKPEKTRLLFKELGKVMEITETQLPGAMALASCGIAFAFRYIRAACEGGVELGIRAKEAQDIVCQTLKGAVQILSLPDSHPEVEIDKVTTPGGFTIRGLNAMERAGFTTAVIEGLKACVK